jgi:hypothetical protein
MRRRSGNANITKMAHMNGERTVDAIVYPQN